jgi:hypothetical protein
MELRNRRRYLAWFDVKPARWWQGVIVCGCLLAIFTFAAIFALTFPAISCRDPRGC